MSKEIRNMHYALRTTHYALRTTHHVSRFTFHVSRFTFHASWVDFRPYLGFRLEMLGKKGRIEIDLTPSTTHLVTQENGVFREERFEFPYNPLDPSWVEELCEFRNAIWEGRQPDGNGGDGLEALKMIDAVYESTRLGGQVVSLSNS